MTNWFEIDHGGLAEIAKRRGMAFVVTEPIQNAWDEDTTHVEITLEPVPRKPRVDITVRDDFPNGFRDITDSYMLFRESYKLANPEQRGRFNVGEKLLLAMAEYARVDSTTGSVIFDEKGRRRGRKRTETGSVLTARLKMTRDELDEALEMAHTIIPPNGVITVVNGETLPNREPVASASRYLDTEIRGEEGGFKYVYRTADLLIYETLPGEKPHLYEMGIPIDEIDCPWHVSVGQKVPLSMDRGSVRTGYISRIQEAAAEIMADKMSEDVARDGWVSKALDRMSDDDAVREIVKRKFGKAVTFDPSCQEANKRALDAGFHVVKGGELSKDAWQTVRRAKALLPAGRVFKVGIETHPDGKQPEDPEAWDEAMTRFAEYARLFALHVVDRDMEINFYRLQGENALAFCRGTEIGLNLSSGGRALLSRWDQEEIDALLIHECAHVTVSDHLTDEYHEECCRIGAKLRTFNTELWQV